MSIHFFDFRLSTVPRFSTNHQVKGYFKNLNLDDRSEAFEEQLGRCMWERNIQKRLSQAPGFKSSTPIGDLFLRPKRIEFEQPYPADYCCCSSGYCSYHWPNERGVKLNGEGAKLGLDMYLEF